MELILVYVVVLVLVTNLVLYYGWRKALDHQLPACIILSVLTDARQGDVEERHPLPVQADHAVADVFSVVVVPTHGTGVVLNTPVWLDLIYLDIEQNSAVMYGSSKFSLLTSLKWLNWSFAANCRPVSVVLAACHSIQGWKSLARWARLTSWCVLLGDPSLAFRKLNVNQVEM